MSFSDSLLQDAYMIFLKSVEYFENTKHAQFRYGVQFPLNFSKSYLN